MAAADGCWLLIDAAGLVVKNDGETCRKGLYLLGMHPVSIYIYRLDILTALPDSGHYQQGAAHSTSKKTFKSLRRPVSAGASDPCIYKESRPDTTSRTAF